MKKVYLTTTTAIDFVSLHHDMKAAIADAGADSGVIHVLVPKGGAGLLVFENLPEVREALTTWLQQWNSTTEVRDRLRRQIRLAPRIQSAILPRSVSIPFEQGELLLGPYEEVILVDCEPRSQRREVLIVATANAAAKEGPPQ